MSYNKAILVGRLGANAEKRYTQKGTAVVNFNMATSRNWKDDSGQRQERTEWHKIVIWGKMGEAIEEYLLKGKEVLVEGEIQTRQWEDKDGNKRYTTEINAGNVRLLGSRRDNASDGAAGAQPERSDPSGSQVRSDELTEDDIPF